MEVKKKPGPETRGRPTQYPYEEWTDGEWHAIDPQTYVDEEITLRRALYQYAYRNGRKVQFRRVGGRRPLQFQFFDVE